MTIEATNQSYDFVIIGSGFGGSVAAMRLAQKGYTVALLEEGKRWNAATLPRTNWNLSRYLWAPRLGCFGIQAITWLKGVLVLHGRGVGGGSLVYANTLMAPRDDVLNSNSWCPSVDWQKELTPHFNIARRMLGARTNPELYAAEEALREVGKKLGVENTFHPTEVGVFFGEPEVTVPDPYFEGQGPERAGCIGCGGCMVGCRYNAKNTLDRNYLWFAERWGTRIFPQTRAVKIAPTEGGYLISTEKANGLRSPPGPDFMAKRVVVAAGVLGSLKLFLKCRDHYKTLPKISSTLGFQVRTNGESLLGATSLRKDRDYSKGIAIGAAIHPDEQTKIEAVKYPSGSTFMRVLAIPLTPDGTRLTRPLKLLGKMITQIGSLLRLALVRDWARRTVILLVMQSQETHMRFRLRGNKLEGLPDHRLPSFLPIAQESAVHLARVMEGEPQNVVSEVLFATPATAHILGGCCISDSPEAGVVNSNHEVFGYPGLYVCDGSVIPANLGVNPSLTITALAERFCSLFPAKNLETYASRHVPFQVNGT